MNKNHLDKLEFNKILDKISFFAVTDLGKNIANNLFPSTNKEKIIKMQKETTEALALLYRKGELPLFQINDILPYISLLEKGNFLSTSALLSLANVLKLSRLLKEYYFENPLNNSDILDYYFSSLYTNARVEQHIFSAIIDEDTIADDASEKLSSIRKEYRKINQEIKNKLHSILNSKYLQEPIITLKNNRFVVPVKAEYRQEIKGFVHDTSTSGSTVFIEPLVVFELNNKLGNLKNDETAEIEKILQKLSSLFFDMTSELKNNYELIGIIDFIFSKAKFSKQIDGIEPIISDVKEINLIEARHPLIDSENVVPISLSIGKNFTSLVITGPNTGGKTVTLKTTGLLTAMAMAGIHIPAKKPSSIYVFDNIFADIGDKQSIQQSLSTFSSHMVNIIDIINTATADSLVLLDELGSGTDPSEGANLAISILDFLEKKNILTISTTHYSEIKTFAIISKNFENASCEFDVNTLSPTYRLLIGVPGKSNAFEISKKLGLSDSILNKAKSLLKDDALHVEELLKNIYDDKLLIEKEKETILKNSEEINNLKISLQNEKDELSSKKSSLISKAKEEARNIVLSAKEEADTILREIENSKDAKKMNALRKDLNKKLSEYSNDSNFKEETLTPISIEDIKIGSQVFIPSLNQIGIIRSLPNNSNKVMVNVRECKNEF